MQPDQNANSPEQTLLLSIRTAVEEELRPYVNSHGGSIEVVSFEQGRVRVALSGACKGCSAQNITLKYGVERSLRKKFREINTVELVSTD